MNAIMQFIMQLLLFLRTLQRLRPTGLAHAEVVLWDSTVHVNVHLVEIQYVQFTFAQNTNDFMNC